MLVLVFFAVILEAAPDRASTLVEGESFLLLREPSSCASSSEELEYDGDMVLCNVECV